MESKDEGSHEDFTVNNYCLYTDFLKNKVNKCAFLGVVNDSAKLVVCHNKILSMNARQVVVDEVERNAFVYTSCRRFPIMTEVRISIECDTGYRNRDPVY